MRILLIAGHGQGDSGAVGNGTTEAEETRVLVSLIQPILSKYTETVVYPYDKDCYQQSRNGNPPNWTAYDYVFEIHFNSADVEAHGTEILIHPTEPAHSVEDLILRNVCQCGFVNRGIKIRSDLGNMNRCRAVGVSYALLETCFINSTDMQRYFSVMESVAYGIVNGIIEGFGITSNLTPPEDDEIPSNLYKVQTGAFKVKSNATTLSNKLKNCGYDNFIVWEGNLYKVQVGAFSVYDNAVSLRNELKEKGFDTFIKRY